MGCEPGFPFVGRGGRGAVRYVALSAAILLPCFWYTHVHAHDLASHMYNVWLAELIEQGEAPGLYLATIRTNVLFDVWAQWLAGRVGYQWAERLGMSTAVLTFYWGAWYWMRRKTHREPWAVAGLLAMFSYGWVFHMGFVNFYWSMGFCLWGLAMAESPRAWERRLWWIPFLPAGVAHMLPVGWAGALWAYGQAMRRTPGRRRGWLLAGGVAGIALVSVALQMRYRTHWSLQQAFGMLGADQLFRFEPAYMAVALGYLLILAFGLLFVAHGQSIERLSLRRDLHYAVLTAVGVLMIPWVVHLPGFSGPLSFITHRMSLAVAVLLCGLLPLSRRTDRLGYAGLALACVYFGLIYRDGGELEDFETKLHAAVRTAPAGSRVVAPYGKESARMFSYGHLVDRACIGHCFSYANYEASTAQFRVRARGPNAIVAHEVKTSLDLQTEEHTVRAEEAPLYYFRWRPEERRFELRVMGPGDTF
jgi:hypothetical protein